MKYFADDLTVFSTRAQIPCLRAQSFNTYSLKYVYIKGFYLEEYFTSQIFHFMEYCLKNTKGMPPCLVFTRHHGTELHKYRPTKDKAQTVQFDSIIYYIIVCKPFKSTKDQPWILDFLRGSFCSICMFIFNYVFCILFLSFDSFSFFEIVLSVK